MALPNIFEFLNYREYLLEFYIAKKVKNPNFSYQVFANMAGFKSKSFIKLVIDGKKNLTSESSEKLNKVLKLSKKSFSYFQDLIAFEQAKNLEMKNLLFEKLIAYNARNPARIVLRQQYAFYSKWYNNTIRELVTMYHFGENYDLLGKMVKPSISAKDARESVKLLLNLNLIQKTADGYRQTDALITTGDEVRSLAVQNFHLQNLNLAGQSMEICPAKERDISCLVLGLSQSGIEKIRSEVQAFRKKMLQIAQADNNVNSVYHLNFQFFPTCKKVDENDE